MSFDVDPSENSQIFPCDCGGNITESKEIKCLWECDSCDFERYEVNNGI